MFQECFIPLYRDLCLLFVCHSLQCVRKDLQADKEVCLKWVGGCRIVYSGLSRGKLRNFPSIQYLQIAQILNISQVWSRWRWKPKVASSHHAAQLCWIFVKQLYWLYDFCHSHQIWLCHSPQAAVFTRGTELLYTALHVFEVNKMIIWTMVSGPNPWVNSVLEHHCNIFYQFIYVFPIYIWF